MITLLQIEWLKIKRTHIVSIATVLPLLAAYQGWAFSKGKTDQLTFEETLLIGSLSFYCWLALPLLITAVIAMMAWLEHSGSVWKQLLALPVSREKVYLAKLLAALLIILYSMLLLFGGIALAAWNLGLAVSVMFLFQKLCILCLTVSPMVGVIFLLSYQFSHIAIPLTVGAGLSFPSMFIANSEKYWIFYPWDYPIMGSLSHVFPLGGKQELMYAVCITLFLICFSTGFLQFKKKDIL